MGIPSTPNFYSYPEILVKASQLVWIILEQNCATKDLILRFKCDMTHCCLALSSLFLQGNGMNEVGSPICSYFHKAGKFMKVMDKHNSFEQLSFPIQFFGDASPSTLTCEYEAKFGKKGHSQHDSACTNSQLYDLSPLHWDLCNDHPYIQNPENTEI